MHFQNERTLWTEIHLGNLTTTWKGNDCGRGDGNLNSVLEIYHKDHVNNPMAGTKVMRPPGQRSKLQGSPSTRDFWKGKLGYQLVGAVFFLIRLLALDNILMVTSKIILPSKLKF